MTEKTQLRKYQKAARITGLLLVLALIAAALPLSGTVFAQQNCARSHTVQSGETLSGIALKYDTTVLDLAKLNNLTEPYTLMVNQVLCLPGAAATTATPTGSSSSSSKDKDAVSFTVTDNGKKIVLNLDSTSTRNIFFVRVSERGFGTQWYKVGLIKTNKDRAEVRQFRLPSELVDEDLSVCLKNVRSDKLVCRTVWR